MRELILCVLPFLSAFYHRKCRCKKHSVLPKVSQIELLSELCQEKGGDEVSGFFDKMHKHPGVTQ